MNTQSNKVTLALGCITNRVDERFRAMIDSIPARVSTVLIVDALPKHLSQTEWEKLVPKKSLEIITHPPEIPDFAKLRNTVLKRASELGFEWLLFLDSDEVWKATDADLLHTISQADRQAALAISCLRSDVFLHKKLRFGEAGNQRLPRLLRTSGVSFHGATHEAIASDTLVYHSHLPIAHHSHESIAQFITINSMYAQRIAQMRRSSKSAILFEILFFPLGKWLYNVVLRLGFLDGWRGLVYATCMSLHSLMVRIYRYEHFYCKKSH